MRRLVIVATLALLVAAVVAVPVARALRASESLRPSIGAPRASDIGQTAARLTAVVDTAGLGGTLAVSYGRTSALRGRDARSARSTPTWRRAAWAVSSWA